MTRPILFVGDMHLGRSPHRLGAAGLDPTLLNPAEAWRRVQRFAMAQGVQAVVLAGDVVDQEKDRFEAFGHLHRGVTQLLEAGIAVVGVAGNHDAIALPRLAERIDGFVLLGEGGQWQRHELDGVDLVGWSFPARHHHGDPLQEPGLSAALQTRRPDHLCLGVLHTDVDGGQSPYAPTTRRDLEAVPVDGWMLGHVHRPDPLVMPQPIGYLGSLVGLDRGEVGPRGPWLATPTGSHRFDIKQIPLGPVLWREIAIDVSDLVLSTQGHDALHDALMRGLSHAAANDLWLAAGDFSAVGCTIHWQGRTDAEGVLRRFMAERSAGELMFPIAGVDWVVVAMRSEVQPRRDLEALANEASPVGQVAGLLLELGVHGAAAIPKELSATRFDPTAWLVDEGEAPLPGDVEATRAAAVRLLEQLLTQRGAQRPTSGPGTMAAPNQREALPSEAR